MWPGLDDKVLTAWNGLMLAAIAEAGRALKREDYIAAATKNATFLYNTMRKADARLYRTWKAGSQPKYNAYLEDYAFLADGLLALYQTTFETRWFSWASELAEHMPRHFKDEERSGFFDTSDDHEDLIHRPKDLEDNATPSGNAMAAQVLFKLSLYSGDSDARQTAEEAVQAMVDLMRQYPFGFGEWLNTAQLIYSQPLEIALIGDGEVLEPLLRVVSDGYRPDIIVAAGEESTNNAIPLLAERPQIGGKATAYVCRSFVCDQPTSDPETLRQQIER